MTVVNAGKTMQATQRERVSNVVAAMINPCSFLLF